MGKIGCSACGVCCELYGHTVTASEDDFGRWRAEGRGDVAAWAATPAEEREEGCPFLVRTDAGGGVCSIHETKPEMCRAYPTALHGGWCVMRAKHTPAGSEGR